MEAQTLYAKGIELERCLAWKVQILQIALLFEDEVLLII